MRDFHIDAVNPAVDHRHRAVFISKLSNIGIDPDFQSCSRHGRHAPSIKCGITANGWRKCQTDFVEGGIGGKWVSLHSDNVGVKPSQ